MTRDGGTFRSRLLGSDDQFDERMVEAVESRLDGTESVVDHLTASGPLVHEHGGERTERGDEAVLAVTDRKLVFVIRSETERLQTADVPYTDLRTVEEGGGLLRTQVSITVWGRGTFRLRPRETDRVADVVAFVTEASETWQRTVAALQDARQQFVALSDAVEDGDMAAARAAREAVHEKVATARERAGDADDPVLSTIEERAEAVERDLARTRMETRFERAGTLRPRARELADAGAYTGAYATLARARAHVETALAIATEWEFPMADRLRSETDALAERIADLESLPLERAQRALERALSVDDPRRAVAAWEDALAHYRDALAAGWGTDADFDGGTDALRMQIEWLVATVLDVRCRLAQRYESEGDTYHTAGARAVAGDRYETACTHLAAARRLAAQYRAGDVESIREQFGWVAGKPGAPFERH